MGSFLKEKEKCILTLKGRIESMCTDCNMWKEGLRSPFLKVSHAVGLLSTILQWGILVRDTPGLWFLLCFPRVTIGWSDDLL